MDFEIDIHHEIKKEEEDWGDESVVYPTDLKLEPQDISIGELNQFCKQEVEWEAAHLQGAVSFLVPPSQYWHGTCPPPRWVHCLKHGFQWRQRFIQKLLRIQSQTVGGRKSAEAANIILTFLARYTTMSRVKHTRCYNCSVSLYSPKVITCSECLLQFQGLHDRFFNFCLHFKASHKTKCNVMIVRNWLQQRSAIMRMVSAWQQDLVDLFRGNVGCSCSCAHSNVRCL